MFDTQELLQMSDVTPRPAAPTYSGTNCWGGTELAKGVTSRFSKRIHTLFCDWVGQKKPQRDSGISVVGVGSVGRNEMLKLSDADLLVLRRPDVPESLVENLKARIREESERKGYGEQFIRFAGSDTVETCVGIARADDFFNAEIKTCRLLAGDESLFQEFTSAVQPHLFSRTDYKIRCNALLDLWAWNEDHRFVYEHVCSPNIKRGRGAMRNVLAVALVGKTLYAANGDSCVVILGELKKHHAFRDLMSELDSLVRAFDFYLFLRHQMHEIRCPSGKPQIPTQTLKTSLDVLDADLRAAIARTLPGRFRSPEDVLCMYNHHRSGTLDAFNRLSDRFVRDILASRGDRKWERDFCLSCKAATISPGEQQRLATNPDLLIRFALAWHATYQAALSDVYKWSQNHGRRRGGYGYWNVNYALSRNTETPPSIRLELTQLEGIKNRVIRKRALETLQMCSAKEGTP